MHLSPLCDIHSFSSLAGSSCGHCRRWAGLGVGMCQGESGEEEVSWVLGKTDLSWWVGTVIVSFLDTQTEQDRMEFLRLHLPGLHQALRGALDSLSTFVSYLIGDEVPTAERREAWAAEELGEVAAEKSGRTVEEEAQKALEGLGGSQSKGVGGLRGPGEAGRRPEESSAAEQTWGGGEGSSHGSQADRQDTGAWETAKATSCQDSSVPLETRKKSEAGSESGGDRRSQAQESRELDEQEVNREETLRTWEQEEEEEEFRATEPGVAGGEESEWTWQKEPEGKASADGLKVARDSQETEQVVKEAATKETQGPGAKGAGREEEEVVVVRHGQSTRAQRTQGTQEPEAESEHGEPSGKEEAGTSSGMEEAALPGVKETEYGTVPGERIPEDTGRVWALEETSKGDQAEVDENKEFEVSLFPNQTQALGIEGVEEVARDQAEGRTAEENHGSEEEVGEGLEGQADWAEEEAMGRQDSEIRAAQASLEEVVQAEEAGEQESFWAAEAGLPQGKVADRPEHDADLEATPEARAEKVFSKERGEEEAQTGGEALEVECCGLEHKVTEGKEPELMEAPKAPTEQPEEGQAGKEVFWSVPVLSEEETERSLEEYPRNMGYEKPNSSVAEAWEHRRRRGVEGGSTQEEKADAEVGKEEATGGQAVVAEAEGGREPAQPEIPEANGEWIKAKEAGRGAEEEEAPGTENQELSGGHRAEAGTGQSLGESDARETKEEEVEATVPCGADRTSRRGWRPEAEALSLHDGDGEDMQANSLAAEIVEDKAALDGRAAGEGPEREAGEAFKTGWDSEGREEAGGGEEMAEAAEEGNRGGQESGLEGLAEAFEAMEGEPGGEQAEVRDSAVAEGSCGMDGFTSGSQAVGAEGLPGEQTVLEKESEGWEAGEQGQDSEGQRGDQHPEGQAQRPLDVEDDEVAEDQKAEAEDIDPRGLEDVQGQEDQSTKQDPAEAKPGPHGEASGRVGEDVHSSWSEAPLPGSRLDVSVPRSRVLLSRSSSQRRSRPSLRRTPGPEQLEEPPSPPSKEELSAPEQRLLQPEGLQEPSPPRPEGTPLPARRMPLGQGFGLAHPGMMQELRTRLSQPKP
uniref:Apolipoprotein B receptor n=1 Tax=Camelus bactrianus TaxID=9837 RepID=A0A9W3H4G0_CAMBA|nr:apolipoprotein B receptor [Camelus bactrianus]